MKDTDLSGDARLAAGCMFALMNPDSKTERLRFDLVKSKPTVRMEMALAELVRAGYLTEVKRDGGVGYILNKSCEHFTRQVRRLTKELGPLIVVEPIKKDA